MGWADKTIEELRNGNVSRCRPRGGSMRGRIESGQIVTLDPKLEPKVGDVVLCRVKGKTYLHLIKAVKGHGDNRRYLIGNNRGRINGWTSTVYGVATEVRD